MLICDVPGSALEIGNKTLQGHKVMTGCWHVALFTSGISGGNLSRDGEDAGGLEEESGSAF